MDNPTVTTQRDSVPDWAKPKTVDEAEYGQAGKITERQRSYLLDLIAKKHTPKAEAEGKIDIIMKCLRISEDPEEFGMSKHKASELIEWFLKQPDKPKVTTVTDGVETSTELSGLPPGRYAVENNDGELRFYQCWESRDKKAKRIYVMFGPYEARLPFPAQTAIAKKIIEAGVRECAIRFGVEIGSCSNCGRRLTNRISRELGIGPVCGGRMFGDDGWRDEVKTKRAEIRQRGEDPDEELTE